MHCPRPRRRGHRSGGHGSAGAVRVHRSGAAPDHERAGHEDVLVRSLPGDPGQEQPGRRPALLLQVLVDRGDPRPGQGSRRVVVEARHHDVLGNPEPALGHRLHGDDGGGVVGGDHGVEIRATAEQIADRLRGDVVPRLAVDEETLVHRQAAGRELGAEHPFAFGVVDDVGQAPDHGGATDPALVEQMPHDHGHGVDVVGPDAGGTGVVRGDVHRGQVQLGQQAPQLLTVLRAGVVGGEHPLGGAVAQQAAQGRRQVVDLGVEREHDQRDPPG